MTVCLPLVFLLVKPSEYMPTDDPISEGANCCWFLFSSTLTSFGPGLLHLLTFASNELPMCGLQAAAAT